MVSSTDLPPPSTDPRLGRLPEFDERSLNFPIRATLAVTQLPRSYTWSCPLVLDQGSEGSCVGHAWAHEIAARPITWPSSSYLARLIYREAQKIDPWPGEGYEGTSVLAGVKIAASLGHYKEYRWAFGLDDLILALGYKGPAVLGINWYQGFYTPDSAGRIWPTGSVVGGHAILANGVNMPKRLIRLHNSWGPGWGINGEAFISFDDLSRLLSEGGEACVPVVR